MAFYCFSNSRHALVYTDILSTLLHKHRNYLFVQRCIPCLQRANHSQYSIRMQNTPSNSIHGARFKSAIMHTNTHVLFQLIMHPFQRPHADIHASTLLCNIQQSLDLRSPTVRLVNCLHDSHTQARLEPAQRWTLYDTYILRLIWTIRNQLLYNA